MWDVPGGRHGPVVEGDGLGGVGEGAVVGGEGEAGLPEMETGGAVWGDAKGEGELCGWVEGGRVDAGGRDGEVDHEEGVDLRGR